MIDNFNFRQYSTLQIIATDTYTAVSRIEPVQHPKRKKKEEEEQKQKQE